MEVQELERAEGMNRNITGMNRNLSAGRQDGRESSRRVVIVGHREVS